MLQLGVNIDHVATVREARKADYPDPIEAAIFAQLGGADQITIHLREDRRHIQDRDLEILSKILKVPLNLELALNDDVIQIALKTKPQRVCVVPENRAEITTEGGLDVLKHQDKLKEVIPLFKKENIEVSLFIDPDIAQVKAAFDVQADAVEFHTGAYANAENNEDTWAEVERLEEAIDKLVEMSEEYNYFMKINLGHGLNYQNLLPLLGSIQISLISELNIGHSIIGRALSVGIERAVRDMKDIIWKADMLEAINEREDFFDSMLSADAIDDDFIDDEET